MKDKPEIPHHLYNKYNIIQEIVIWKSRYILIKESEIVLYKYI
jgi:hypothetical protein